MNKKRNCAAFAQIDITPDFPVELIGCYRKDNIAEGVLHRLYAQTLLLEFEEKYYCLITIDNLGLTTVLSDKLRDMITDRYQIPRSHIMLNFSHTHSAPFPLSNLNGQRYYQFLCEQVLGTVQTALTELRPCKIGWDYVNAEIAENRRAGCTVVDQRMGGLKIVAADDHSPIALILRLSCHANVLMEHSNFLSGDFISDARDKMAEEFHCPLMIIQGAAGNLKPIGIPMISGGTPEDVPSVSDRLIQAARQLSFCYYNITKLTMSEKEIHLHSPIPSQEEAAKIAEDARKLFQTDGSAWLKECDKLRQSGIDSQVITESLQFLFINEGCLCGIPDEIFCELSLETADRTDPLVFFNGYTNGCTSYLPTSEEWAKGGYETLYSFLSYYPFHGHVMPFQAETGNEIIEQIVTEWKRRN